MNHIDHRDYIVGVKEAIELAKAMLDGEEVVYYHYGEWKPLQSLSFNEILICKFPMRKLKNTYVNIGKNMLVYYLRNYQVYFKYEDGSYLKFSAKHEAYLNDYEGDFYIMLLDNDKYERINN